MTNDIAVPMVKQARRCGVSNAVGVQGNGSEDVRLGSGRQVGRDAKALSLPALFIGRSSGTDQRRSVVRSRRDTDWQGLSWVLVFRSKESRRKFSLTSCQILSNSTTCPYCHVRLPCIVRLSQFKVAMLLEVGPHRPLRQSLRP